VGFGRGIKVAVTAVVPPVHNLNDRNEKNAEMISMLLYVYIASDVHIIASSLSLFLREFTLSINSLWIHSQIPAYIVGGVDLTTRYY
jgi:hypothetical protein